MCTIAFLKFLVAHFVIGVVLKLLFRHILYTFLFLIFYCQGVAVSVGYTHFFTCGYDYANDSPIIYLTAFSALLEADTT